MLGAFVLLVLFLLINRDSLGFLQSLAEDARGRFGGADPHANVLVVIMLAAAIACAVVMMFWPSLEEPRRQQVLHRYFGPAYASLHRETVRPPLRMRARRLCQAALNRARRFRNYVGLAFRSL
jgi:hypothetical protein